MAGRAIEFNHTDMFGVRENDITRTGGEGEFRRSPSRWNAERYEGQKQREQRQPPSTAGAYV